MELNEMRSVWQATNKRLDEQGMIQAAMQKLVLEDQTRSTTQRLRVEPIFELIAAVILAIWTGGFLADNIADIQRAPIGAIPAFLLWVMSALVIGNDVRQLTAISGLDFSKPVIDTQRTIATVRSMRVRSTQFALLVGVPLWFLFPIFFLQAIGTYEVALKMNALWIAMNLLVGVLISLGVILASRKYGAHSTLLQSIDDALAGRAIARAQSLLNDVKEFERA